MSKNFFKLHTILNLKKLFFSFIKNMIFFIIISIILVKTGLANPKISVDRNPINLGETFQLNITLSNKDFQNQSVDFSKLQADFNVIGITQGREYDNINGTVNDIYRWVLTLSPKKIGLLNIPALKIGSEYTAPLNIQVNAASNPLPTGEKPPVFLQAKISNTEGYEQSPIVYTLTIYYDVDISGADILPPSTNDAAIIPFGQDKSFQTKINGKSYQVFERNYLITPEKTGSLLISPATFQGQILQPLAGSNFYDFFNAMSARNFRLNANPIQIDVQNKPTWYKGWWFPANNVTISDNWTGQQPTMQVGIPLTRIIKIQAKGASAEQIPNFTWSDLPNVHIYASAPKRRTWIEQGQLQSELTQKITYVPIQGPSLNLPAIELSWWNIHTKQIQTATLPATSFKILPGNPSTVAQQKILLNQPTLSSQHTQNTTISPQNIYSYFNFSQLHWLFITLTLLILLISTWSWIFFSRFKTKKILIPINSANPEFESSQVTDSSLENNNVEETNAAIISSPKIKKRDKLKNDFEMELENACRKNDLLKTKKNLILWLNQIQPSLQVTDLQDVYNACLSPEFKRSLVELEQALYSQSSEDWQGSVFWHTFVEFGKSAFHAESNNNNEDAPLPDLYPKT